MIAPTSKMNYQAQIAAAEAELDSGELPHANQLREALVKAGDAQAIYLAGCMSKRGEADSKLVQLRNMEEGRAQLETHGWDLRPK